MIRRSTRIALEVLVGLLLAAVLIAAALLWRLSDGPVSVDFLTPELERAFAAADSPLTVDVGSTELIWGGWDRTVGLRARDWRVNGPDGQRVAQLPEVDIALSLRALAQGVIAPTSVEVSGASLTLERDREGRFGVAETAVPDRLPMTQEVRSDRDTSQNRAGFDAEETPAEIAALLPELAARLLAPADPSDPLSFLNSLRGRDLTVTLIDRAVGTTLTARNGSIELFRQDDGIAGTAGLSLDIADRPMMLEATLDYGAADGRLRIAAAFQDLDLSRLGRLAPDLEPLSQADLSLDGLVDLVLDADGRIDRLAFDFAAGAGRLSLPAFYSSPLELAAVAAVGTYEAATRRIAVEDFSLQFGNQTAVGPNLRARLNLDLGEGFHDLGIGARVDRVDVADLERYWPAGASENGRTWVLGNIAAGAAENLEVVASLRFPDSQAQDPPEDLSQEPILNSFQGGFDFSGLEIHYNRPMPPVTEASGRAVFDSDGLSFDVEQGRLQELQFDSGSVEIFGLSGEDHRLAIDADVRGGVKPALEVLNHPRLLLIDKLGVPLEGSGGAFAARVGFAFPLIDALTDEEIDITATAELSDVMLMDAVSGLDVTEGQLALDLDVRSMTLSGPLRLGGLPLDLDWTEYFEARDGVRREVTASTDALDAAARAQLGVPLAEQIRGPVAADLRLVGLVDETSDVEIALQLVEAEMDIPRLAWRKPAGVAGTARLVAQLWGQRLVALRNVEVFAGDLAVTGAATFSPDDGGLILANLNNVTLGGSSLDDISVRPWPTPAGEGWEVQVGGGRLDAAPWLDDEESSDQPDEAEPDTPQTPLKLQVAQLQFLHLGKDRGLEAVALEGERGPRGWERLSASAEVPRLWWRRNGQLRDGDAEIPQKLIRFDWGPVTEGSGYALELGADDLGAVLRVFGWVDEMEGGQTRIVGTSPGPLLSAPIEAELELRQYTLVDAPLLGRIVAGASLGGLGGMLAEDNGITFERGVGELVLEQGVLSTDLLRAYGPALGITARGTLDTEADAIDLQGTLVPAYAINQVLGAIPILGPLLTGGEGEGVLGVTYSVSGSLDDPDVDVNPLSALAPGFLRGIFSGKIDGSEEALEALPPSGAQR
ncbi:YhdP family protein [Algihabitans albus]|uniref:YhdP family protein n=1 Tax=Algihabitans albus TaxID=2164067 RepID=UPI000E5C7745|nr:AsmA-like C-terminal domain-containing protein [Algihabitans albus]